MTQFRCVDTDVAIHNNNCAICCLENVFVMHITEVNILRGISPVTGIAKFKTHAVHIVYYPTILHMPAFDKRLFHHNLEFTIFCTPETKNR